MKFGPPLFWLGLSLWVGGLAAIAVAAPAVFRNSPSRESAGVVFGSMLRSFSRVEIACAVLAAAGLALTWNRPAATIDWVRAGLLGLMILILIVLQAWIVPTMEGLRPQMGDYEAARERFQWFHRISESLYKISLLSGLALIVMSAWSSRRPV